MFLTLRNHHQPNPVAMTGHCTGSITLACQAGTFYFRFHFTRILKSKYKNNLSGPTDASIELPEENENGDSLAKQQGFAISILAPTSVWPDDKADSCFRIDRLAPIQPFPLTPSRHNPRTWRVLPVYNGSYKLRKLLRLESRVRRRQKRSHSGSPLGFSFSPTRRHLEILYQTISRKEMRLITSHQNNRKWRHVDVETGSCVYLDDVTITTF